MAENGEAALLDELEALSQEFAQVTAMSFAGADPAAVTQARRDLGERQADLLEELQDVRREHRPEGSRPDA